MYREQIDARNIELHDLVIKLKDLLSTKLGEDVEITISIATWENAKKIKTFFSMSGCQSIVNKKDEYYIIEVTGNPCCV
jgi:hypothetical protein